MTDKVAVVNGGAGGIGGAVVERIAADDYAIHVLDQNEAAGREVTARLTAQGRTARFHTIELRDSAAVKATFATILQDTGRIDLLVNLAGGTLHKRPIVEFSLAQWQEVIDVNLKATFLCCQAVCRTMRERRSGVIVNTASNIGITGAVGRTPYAASKAATVAFSKSLALELAPYGVRVNTIAPGMTETARIRREYDEAGWRAAGAALPMGRLALPTDIAEGIAFLASDDSAFMTGQTLHVNGGMVFY
jgi:NAD(P)-dependent dehydrogenase (short-subunit alcohol dehydrogenase family)